MVLVTSYADPHLMSHSSVGLLRIVHAESDRGRSRPLPSLGQYSCCPPLWHRIVQPVNWNPVYMLVHLLGSWRAPYLSSHLLRALTTSHSVCPYPLVSSILCRVGSSENAGCDTTRNIRRTTRLAICSADTHAASFSEILEILENFCGDAGTELNVDRGGFAVACW